MTIGLHEVLYYIDLVLYNRDKVCDRLGGLACMSY
jgi:hypothetical protein